MDDIAVHPPIADASTTSPAVRRGRKSETPQQRLERLQQAVAEAKQAARQAEQRMFAVVGEALLAEAATDSALKARIVDILRRRVTAASAKSDIAVLLSL